MRKETSLASRMWSCHPGIDQKPRVHPNRQTHAYGLVMREEHCEPRNNERSIFRRGYSSRSCSRRFYAKGSSSVAQLFEKLCAIKDEVTRHSVRVAAPIWIPGVPIDRGCLATIAVECPESFRTFPHRLRDAKLLRTECCCPRLPSYDATSDGQANSRYGSNRLRDTS
jgi:hypothetical protein